MSVHARARTVPWTPGSPGKGLVFEDRLMILWATDDETDGGPHHGTVAERLMRERQPSVALWIDANGTVGRSWDDLLGDDELAAMLTQQDPSLHLSGRWDFT